MQKFIIGLAIGVAVGTLVVTYSKSARELASASKDFASQKIQNAKKDVESKTEEIKEKTASVAVTDKKSPAAKKPSTKKITSSKES